MTISEIIKKRKFNDQDLWFLPIKDPHHCDHNGKEIRKQTHGAYVLQCPQCGSTCSNSLAHKSMTQEQMESALPFDYKRREQGWDFSSESRQMQRAHGIKPMDSIKRDSYDDYLRSPEWKAKRQIIIKREANICQGCLSAPIEEVHHSTYSNIGDELMFQLIGLCSNCHRKVHHINSDS